MSADAPLFESAQTFDGPREGCVFKLGHLGLGYYLDVRADTAPLAERQQLEELRPRLPERWRQCTSLRQERLNVDPDAGCGVSLEHSEFGFAVSRVDDTPGQDLGKGDVIVAVEGRLFAGLSGPQMQASFQKRRLQGARLQVADLAEISRLSKMDPAIVECWDAQHQRNYYFHKKTGRSAWSIEELEPSDAASSSGAAEKAPPPIDLASFLSHGFAKPKDLPKARKSKAKANAAAGTGHDESDLAREERKRWADWNAGERGGYTEQFLERYKGCQSNPNKPKEDKRLKGSVGPGQGMEYMARWTGSNNSFN